MAWPALQRDTATEVPGTPESRHAWTERKRKRGGVDRAHTGRHTCANATTTQGPMRLALALDLFLPTARTAVKGN